MAPNDRRPKLQGLSDDDTTRIRAYGLSRGFLPTELETTPAPVPTQPTALPPIASPSFAPAVISPQPALGMPETAAPSAIPLPTQAPVLHRPAPTRPWQAMFPDYLIDELRQAAAREGTAQKVVVLRALRAAGFRVEDIDLQDLRKR